MSVQYIQGQRWVSNTQPELGLGLVLKLEPDRVHILFPARGETQVYAMESAPLRRVIFETGDVIKPHDGVEFVVQDVREEAGLLTYTGDGVELPETGVADTMSFNKPDARLLAGQCEESSVYQLRQQALSHRCEARSRDVRGLIGGRLSLIPHQLYIAHEVALRHTPRVLLADEVGLGKTIEACLILHRLYHSGRVHRALILVPESLVHQWFVELLRRFHIQFNIYDEERCESIEEKDPEANPFLDDQLVLCSVRWLAGARRRRRQAVAAGWDLIIVDEAHHLQWSPESVSPEYETVETLAAETPGLLLLTATPEQLGRQGHFARLRLLDPARYPNLPAFIKEADGYRDVSRLADSILRENPLAPETVSRLRELLEIEIPETPDDAERAHLLEALLDLNGMGRVIFRNRRSSMEGFPSREAHLAPLPVSAADLPKWRQTISQEYQQLFSPDESAGPPEFRFDEDPKITWLADLLRENPDDKFLLICSSRAKAEALGPALSQKINIELGLFHEGLTLIQRDRNAAWFAEVDGARLLICSEIGSEGRNFQFAHHLVLFDLPIDPALLEQRIGRLDRIGQTQTIQIHIPYLAGTIQELWARWFHEGLDALQQCLHGGEAYVRQFQSLMRTLSLEPERADCWEEHWDNLLREAQAFKKRVDEDLEQGRDHLLELSSCRTDAAEALVTAIEEIDADKTLEQFMLQIFDHFGVTVEDLDTRRFLLKPEHLFSIEAFPGLPEEGMTVTFDRGTALGREDIGYLTWDHPMVTSAIDLLLSSERGNASLVKWEEYGSQGLLFEAVYVLECVAPEKLHPERFLPPTPVRVVVDHEMRDRTKDFSQGRLEEVVRDARRAWLRENARPLKKVMPRMLETALALASKRAKSMRKSASKRMREMLDAETERLVELRARNHPVRAEEIRIAEEEAAALETQIGGARLRLDSVRLIRQDV